MALTAWIARPLFVGAIGHLRKAAEKVRGDLKTDPVLKTLGLEKLIPGVVLFLFILAVYAGNALILGIGLRLPFQIKTFQPISLLHHTSKEQLLRLWSQHPDLEFYNLPLALENDLLRLTTTHTSDILSNVKSWEQMFATTELGKT